MITLLYHYFKARHTHFKDRKSLEAHQRKKLNKFASKVLTKSPFYSECHNQPFDSWPYADKSTMMENFDAMNTAGLKRDELFDIVLKSERDRDFSPRYGKFSAGLSSGTSGRRGLFVSSPYEQQVWAGVMLAKMLPDGILAGERVALFLRSDNNLYHSVKSRWLSFEFFDLFTRFESHFDRLEKYEPTIIAAPAQVLRALALARMDGRLPLKYIKKVISVAEVFDTQDRHIVESCFDSVGEVYQATEGFLASTCACGRLHLNEEYVYFEKDPAGKEGRFSPVITDFSRITQPIVRYRLDDILVPYDGECACGNAALAIERIEGRRDDCLVFNCTDEGNITVFADLCSRVIASTLPLHVDYRLIQDGTFLRLIAGCGLDKLNECSEALNKAFETQGVDTAPIKWDLVNQAPEEDFKSKRRRIVRLV